jgi:hypothetical protein
VNVGQLVGEPGLEEPSRDTSEPGGIVLGKPPRVGVPDDPDLFVGQHHAITARGHG